MTKKSNSPGMSHLAAVAVTALFCGSADNATGSQGSTAIAESSAIEQIERYCSKSWRTAHLPRDQWDDSTQQVLTELLERIPRERLGQAIGASTSSERRELNRSIWRIAKRCTRSVRPATLDGYDIASNDRHLTEVDEQIEQILSIAAKKLTDRQNKIIAMLRDGHTVSEIADRMELTPARVSNEKHRAIKQIRRFLCEVV